MAQCRCVPVNSKTLRVRFRQPRPAASGRNRRFERSNQGPCKPISQSPRQSPMLTVLPAASHCSTHSTSAQAPLAPYSTGIPPDSGGAQHEEPPYVVVHTCCSNHRPGAHRARPAARSAVAHDGPVSFLRPPRRCLPRRQRRVRPRRAD